MKKIKTIHLSMPEKFNSVKQCYINGTYYINTNFKNPNNKDTKFIFLHEPDSQYLCNQADLRV